MYRCGVGRARRRPVLEMPPGARSTTTSPPDGNQIDQLLFRQHRSGPTKLTVSITSPLNPPTADIGADIAFRRDVPWAVTLHEASLRWLLEPVNLDRP